MEKKLKKKGLGLPRSSKELLDMYFLEARAHLLEAAAILDRIERGPQGTETFADPKLQKLLQACDILKNERVNRAEKFLLLFSEPEYQKDSLL